MELRFAEIALKDIKSFNKVDQRLILLKLEYLAENFNDLKKTKKVRELKGKEYKGLYRFTIARKIRAIFTIEDNKITLLVLRIGLRKSVY